MSEYVDGSGRSILVVDDDPALGALIATRIRREFGYPVQVTSSAEEAVRFAEANVPHIGIIDYKLGNGLNGMELFEQLTGRAFLHTGVLITGLRDEHVEDDARRAGFHTVIWKESDFFTQLLEVVREIGNEPVRR